MSDIFDKISARIPKDVEIFVGKSFDIADYISETLEEQGKNQKYLADKLHKPEAEINEWLRGSYNFDIKTIAKIEAALGLEIINISSNSINVDK